MKKKYLAWMLSVAMVLGMLPGQAFAAGDDAVTLDLGDGSIVITETGYTQGAAAEETAHTGSYVIEKEYVEVTTNTVTVKSGTVDITLADDINIDVSATSGACAFAVEPGANVTLILKSSAVLKSGAKRAGLEVPTGAGITIRAASKYATLETTGGSGGAGIGGCNLTDKYAGGNITIESGRITAKGGGNAAGIGGYGAGTGENETIRINGGTIKATGGSSAAGVGGGIRSGTNEYCAAGTGTGGAIIFEGTAEVTATGGSGAAGIGGGGYYSSSANSVYRGGDGTGTDGHILITGSAVVTAYGKGGAGIGGGYNESTNYLNGNGTGLRGLITISGNAQVHAESKGYEYLTDCYAYGSGIGGGNYASGTGTDGEVLITDNAHVTAVGSGGSGAYTAGIGGRYGTGTRGKITIKGNPTVIATGCYAGIGGYYATDTNGAINISGGTVTATATYDASYGYGRGIGGYSNGAVNITGGHITATGYYAMSAANLYGGTVVAKATYKSATSAFSTKPTTNSSGNPWILADPGCEAITKGVVFSGTEGVLYGDFYLTKDDREIPEGYTLTVAEGQELVVTEGSTLTVNGTLILQGDLVVEDGGNVVWGENSRLQGNFEHEHSLTATGAKEASCDSAGCIAYWTCTICDAVFTDSQGRNETTAEAVVIPATGHDFENDTCGNCGVKITGASILLPTLSARPGDTVTVPVTLTNNPGLITAKITLTFDTARLQLTKAEDTGLLPGAVFGDTLDSPYVLTWEQGDRTADCTEDGIVANLTFKVLPGASVGAAAITAEVSDTGNTAMESVAFAVTDGAVNVVQSFPGDANSDGVVDLLDVTVLRRFIAAWKDVTVDETASDVNCDGAVGLDDAVILRRYIAGWEGYDLPYEAAQSYSRVRLSGGSPVFAVSRAVGRPGDLVTVDVTLQGNPGIVAAQLTVSYDDTQLELVEAADTGVLPGAIFGDTLASPYKLTWEDGTSADVTADAVVARLTFRVLEGCGGEVAVTVSEGSGHNFELSRVSFAGEPGAVYGNVSADYEGGKIAVNNLPEDMLAMAAAYEDGRMVWVSDVTDSSAISVPSAARNADLWIFFLQDGWKPVGAAQQLN